MLIDDEGQNYGQWYGQKLSSQDYFLLCDYLVNVFFSDNARLVIHLLHPTV